MTELGKALTQVDAPPVKAMVVYNSNPAPSRPTRIWCCADSAARICSRSCWNNSRPIRPITPISFCPSTTFLEHTDLYLAYGHYHLQLARAALQAPGEARSNVEVFRALAQRMGFEDPCFRDSEDDMIRALLGSGHPFLDGITLERLDREHSVRLNVSAGTPFLPFAEGGFGTPSGKCEFGASCSDYTPPVESRLGDAELQKRYPLEMISSKNDDSMNSTFGIRPSVRPPDRGAANASDRRGRAAAFTTATVCARSTIAAACC